MTGEGGVRWPFKSKENFFVFVVLPCELLPTGEERGGGLAVLLWVELVAGVAREEGILEVLLLVLFSGEIKISGVE